MKNKIGDNFLAALYIGVIGYIAFCAIKSKRSVFSVGTADADDIQYSNRLIEFFEKDSIIDAYNQYTKYIDMGISAKDAYLMLTEEVFIASKDNSWIEEIKKNDD